MKCISAYFKMLVFPSSHMDMLNIMSCLFDEVLHEVTNSYLGSNQLYMFDFLSSINIIHHIFKALQGNLLSPQFILIAYMDALS
jgi:hypothetical protein